jgi:hypothetical protein
MVWVVGIGIALFLLFTFPKQMGVVILLLVVGACLLFGGLYIAEQQRDAEYRKREESITLSASFDVVRCSTEFPIFISIRNGYTETIQALTFDLEGYREGFSSPIYRGVAYKSDRIIAPGETHTACWTQPPLDYGAQEIPPAGLIWRASYSYATFESQP